MVYLNIGVTRNEPEIEEEIIEDEEILKNIDDCYFNSEDCFDAQHYQLKKLPEGLDCGDIKKSLNVLYRQHGVVSKKMLQLILEKESQCKEELGKIFQTVKDIGVALAICRESREHLSLAKQQFTTASLGILANYKRKQIIYQLLKNLKTIKTLQKTDERLQELLLEENYPGAINLLLECQIAASNFNHFKCVAQLNCKLQDTLYMTEEQLDVALNKICRKFNLSIYSKLQEAYNLLDKSQTVMDQLLMHFTSEIHSAMFKIVHKFAQTDANLKKQFEQLCKLVPLSKFIPCLQSLCQNLWHILNSYYQIYHWHQSHDKENLETGIPSKDIEITLNKQYVKQKLETGLKRLWNDIQNRISLFLTAHDFADYKFDELLVVLGLVRRLIEVGDEFCNSNSSELENSMRQLTIKYFENYHASKLEELRIFLENESWTQCPVRSKFNLTHLQEFKSLRHTIENHRKSKSHKPSTSETSENDPINNSSSNLSTDGSSYLNNNYFIRFQDGGETPFDSNIDESYYEEDILNTYGERIPEYMSDTSEDSEIDELKKDYVEDGPPLESGKITCPIVANTTLTVLRLCGEYLQMCKLLKPIALDVILSMCQLFDYYLYNVYHFFTKDLLVKSATMLSFKLETTLKRLDELIVTVEEIESNNFDIRTKMVPSRISEMVDLSNKDNLFGLTERIVAVESLAFLGSQFDYIQPYLMHLVPDEKKHLLQHFYLQTVASVSGVRRPSYMCVSGRIIDMNQILKEMSRVNFEVKEVMSQHSSYVDKIVNDLEIFSKKLDSLDINVPVEAYNVLWENVVHIVNNALVEGFSNVKKCSNGGRALMQLDYAQFVCKLEKLTTLRPIPNKEYVELYVKAYYLQENNLEEWIKQHTTEYTSKQLEALINCACQSSRKTKQRLLQILENGK
ncbi:conserved hypothetical protein [Pediculus humanus corporis]|uniref:Syndetin n=1 Tax=Pediculus humanus subsp. corporis TaxID=121224 RepID=E0VNM1_PEDHC|nr:uncharacterized protein Phum_PHUM336920 [Pediculus humanus corporis]EEB14977.1 conserved hypothetical protein [Pediculus humanus corporis]